MAKVCIATERYGTERQLAVVWKRSREPIRSRPPVGASLAARARPAQSAFGAPYQYQLREVDAEERSARRRRRALRFGAVVRHAESIHRQSRRGRRGAPRLRAAAAPHCRTSSGRRGGGATQAAV